MENLSKVFRRKPVVTRIERGIQFLIVCSTCGAVFMKSKNDPDKENHITQLSLRSVVYGHVGAFHHRHNVEKVNLLNGISTPYL